MLLIGHMKVIGDRLKYKKVIMHQTDFNTYKHTKVGIYLCTKLTECMKVSTNHLSEVLHFLIFLMLTRLFSANRKYL